MVAFQKLGFWGQSHRIGWDMSDLICLGPVPLGVGGLERVRYLGLWFPLRGVLDEVPWSSNSTDVANRVSSIHDSWRGTSMMLDDRRGRVCRQTLRVHCQNWGSSLMEGTSLDLSEQRIDLAR